MGFRKLVFLGATMLPSFLKIPLLRAFGAQIGHSCKIGFSIIQAETVELGDHVRIGHCNLLWSLSALRIETGGKIGDFNWVAGGGSGVLKLGRNSSMRRFHFLEASGGIYLGDNSILAGRGINMFTHGLHPNKLADVRPITIGDWCYIGAKSGFVPGVTIGNGVFVGLGAVVSKSHPENYVLLAGNPARPVKKLDVDAAYFAAGYLHHAHHPVGYAG